MLTFKIINNDLSLLYVLLFLFISLIFSVFIMIKKKDKEKAYD